jgi:hypothetical protein
LPVLFLDEPAAASVAGFVMSARLRKVGGSAAGAGLEGPRATDARHVGAVSSVGAALTFGLGQ